MNTIAFEEFETMDAENLMAIAGGNWRDPFGLGEYGYEKGSEFRQFILSLF